MAVAGFLIVLIGALPLLNSSPGAEAGEVGVSYGRVMSQQLDPKSVVKLLQQNGITMMRIYDANPDVLTALANTGIKVMVMMPNEEVAAAAASQSYALEWARCNVSDHYPTTLINGVAIGNEVFQKMPELTLQLVSAMTNVQRALARLGLADAVKVSSPIAFTAFENTWPPSSSRFRDDIAQSVMKPMLQFLRRTGSYLSVNPYPFFAYAENPQGIPLDYALGNYEKGVVDPKTGLLYHSLLDAMMDATYYAMENLTAAQLNIGQSIRTGSNNDIPDAKWTETGHPSQGRLRPGNAGKASRVLKADDGFQPATLANAKAYNNYLINRVLSGKTGTPHRPNADMDVYIFALFNEDNKGQGPDDIEQYFGLFCPYTMSKVYDFSFQGHGTTPAAPPASWCVAKAQVGDAKLKAALDWACGNGADCRDIQPGATCFEPNTMAAHASHAFNSYYQRKSRAAGACDFGGAASVFYQEPKIGNCVLPSKA